MERQASDHKISMKNSIKMAESVRVKMADLAGP